MGNPREIFDIIEIPLYLPLLVLSIITVTLHGFQRNQGWIFLVILSVIRMAGGVAGIISVHNDSKGVIITTIILNNIGISPLLMAMLGLLGRVDSRTPNPFPPRLFRLAYLPAMGGLILAIIGGIDASSSDTDKVSEGSKFTKIGVILFIAALVIYTFIAISLSPKRAYLDAGERHLHSAVLLSVPLIGLRILYSVLVVFANKPDTFSTVTNTDKVVIIEGIMTLLPEILVEVLYLLAGFHLSRNEGPIRSRAVEGREHMRPMAVPHSEDYGYIGESHAMIDHADRYDPPPTGIPKYVRAAQRLDHV